MAATVLSERVHFVSNLFCMPITLLINFALFQYLFGMFYTRRREPRIILLLLCAFLGFAVIIPFAHPERKVYVHLDKVSETCSAVTFLIQITVIGRDINKKMRIKSLVVMTYMSEMLTVACLVLACGEFLMAVVPRFEYAILDTLNEVAEDAALAFTFVFRFYFLAMSKGFKVIWQTRKLEFVLYALLMTHSYPFLILHSWTKADWEPVQAMWNRVTLLLCIMHTVKEKIRSKRKSSATRPHSTHVTKKSRGPTLVVGGGRGGCGGGIVVSSVGDTPSCAGGPVGDDQQGIKADASRPAVPLRMPAWRSGNLSTVRPS